MNSKSFGERLKQYRTDSQYTGKAFAELIDIPYQTYMGYENKNVEPNFDTLIKIATALHVSTDDLLGYKIDKCEYWAEYLQKIGFNIEIQHDSIRIQTAPTNIEAHSITIPKEAFLLQMDIISSLADSNLYLAKAFYIKEKFAFVLLGLIDKFSSASNQEKAMCYDYLSSINPIIVKNPFTGQPMIGPKDK
ncbi:helix-turn-helix transcriptional regulator [Selenomonas sp. AB3002]|uniref:helix-turn-helix domain-containing protein n=1 Tax=Selenomonas sp. AB3002 TaxID=1392502 RepID=UPI00068F8757